MVGALRTTFPRCRKKVVRREEEVEPGVTQREGARGPQTEGPGTPGPRAAKPLLVPMGTWEQRSGLFGLSGATPSTQFPRPRQVSLEARGQHHGEATATAMPSIKHPSLGYKTRATYQQMAPWASACPPSSLIFITSAQPQKAKESPAWPSSRPPPGQSMDVRAASPQAREIRRQGLGQCSFRRALPTPGCRFCRTRQCWLGA